MSAARSLTLTLLLLQCYRDDEVLAFHMQNDTTEEYIQWLRRCVRCVRCDRLALTPALCAMQRMQGAHGARHAQTGGEPFARRLHLAGQSSAQGIAHLHAVRLQ